MATDSCDPIRPLDPMSWESGEDKPSEVEHLDEELKAALLEEVHLSISRLKEDGPYPPHKEVPPMIILYEPGLIKVAWHEDRLVPWRAGTVKWAKYLEYIHDFYEHCVHPTLPSALSRCLDMEKSPAKIFGDMSLSKAIKKRIKDMINEIDLSEGQSAVVAAASMCIAEEALLMSEFDESEGYLVAFSDNVRRCALKLMGYKGSKNIVVSAALLGMKKEAELMRKCLSGDAPNCDEEIVTSGSVRQHTLEVLVFFVNLFAEDISDVNPIEVAPTGKTPSVDGTNALGNNETGLPKKDDSAHKCDGTGVTKRKRSAV